MVAGWLITLASRKGGGLKRISRFLVLWRSQSATIVKRSGLGRKIGTNKLWCCHGGHRVLIDSTWFLSPQVHILLVISDVSRLQFPAYHILCYAVDKEARPTTGLLVSHATC
jgi:hypothetical protein